MGWKKSLFSGECRKLEQILKDSHLRMCNADRKLSFGCVKILRNQRLTPFSLLIMYVQRGTWVHIMLCLRGCEVKSQPSIYNDRVSVQTAHFNSKQAVAALYSL